MLRTGVEYLAAISAVVFAVCLVALMFFYASPSTGPESPSQQHTEKHEAVQSQSEAEKPFWQKATSDPIAAFTLFLVIFTAVLSGVGVIQLRLLVRAETIAEKTAQAAKESGEAAKSAVEATARLERPYLFLNNMKITQAFPDRLPRMQAEFKNAGKTPAFILECVYTIAIEEIGKMQDPAVALRKNPFRCSNLGETIGADASGERFFLFDSFPRPNEMPQFFNHQKNVMLIGEVSYGDVFGNVHTEGFGYSVSVPSPKDFERERDRQLGETDFPIRYFFRIGIGNYKGDPYAYRRTEPHDQWRGFFQKLQAESEARAKAAASPPTPPPAPEQGKIP